MANIQNVGYYILAFTAVFCYACLTIITKKMSADIPPFAFISITMVVLLTLSIISTFIFHKNFSLSSLPVSTWKWLIGYGVLNFSEFALFFIAISKIPAKHYQLIFVMSPLFVALLSYIIFSEATSARFIVGFIFVAAGLSIALT